MVITHLLLATILLCGILGVFGLLISIYALIEVKAMQKSTHKIQWVPMGQPGEANDVPLESPDDTLFNDDEDLFGDDIDVFMDRPPRKATNKEG